MIRATRTRDNSRQGIMLGGGGRRIIRARGILATVANL